MRIHFLYDSCIYSVDHLIILGLSGYAGCLCIMLSFSWLFKFFYNLFSNVLQVTFDLTNTLNLTSTLTLSLAAFCYCFHTHSQHTTHSMINYVKFSSVSPQFLMTVLKHNRLFGQLFCNILRLGTKQQPFLSITFIEM